MKMLLSHLARVEEGAEPPAETLCGRKRRRMRLGTRGLLGVYCVPCVDAMRAEQDASVDAFNDMRARLIDIEDVLLRSGAARP